MKKSISILVIAAMVFTFAFSTVYADSGKNHSNSNATISAYKSKIKQLKDDLKKYRKDEAKKEKILKEIAKEKKKNKDYSFDIIVNGNEVKTSTQPVIKDGKLLLPVRPIVKALGAKLQWIPATQTIIITKGDIKITIQVGSKIAVVNNVKTTLEYKIVLKDGGAMMPMGVIAKILKQTFDYDKDSKIIIVDDDDDDEDDNEGNNANDNYNTVGNIALNKAATASSAYAPSGTTTYVAANAFDGKKSTRWLSAYTDDQWITVDLGAQRYIGKVKLHWEAAYAKAYLIQLSDNGTTWSTYYTNTNGDGGIDEAAIPNIPARYIKALCLQRALTSNGYSLYEMEVFEGVVPSGTLTVTPSSIFGAVNLTAEGTSDWANWGYSAASPFVHKAGVTQKINNYTRVGTVDPVLLAGNNANYSWTAGTPVATVSNSISVPYISGAGNGFEFVVPANTTAQTLKLYVAAMAAKGKLEVSLSDGSAPIYTGYVDSAGIVTTKLFTIDFKALNNGQAILIKYTVDSMYGNNGGGVSLQAAALK